MNRIPDDKLREEWDKLPKYWFDIYQWPRVKSPTYSELIADWIRDSLVDEIKLVTQGLRDSFRKEDHRGQITLSTPITQLNEERTVRALFNASQLGDLGVAIDYEVPLSGPGGRHGDIDLLCKDEDTKTAYCVEAKSPNPAVSTSILLPILQAYTYTMLVQTQRDRFAKEFGLEGYSFSPAVLSFAGTQSAKQLDAMHKWPKIGNLITAMNQQLRDPPFGPLRFFLFEPDPNEAMDNWLDEAHDSNGDTKAVFRDGFHFTISERRLQTPAT